MGYLETINILPMYVVFTKKKKIIRLSKANSITARL